jgi:hypothetical protein
MLHALHWRTLNFGVQRAHTGEHLARRKHQLIRTCKKQIKSWLEFVAGFEDLAATQDVQAESGAGEGDS